MIRTAIKDSGRKVSVGRAWFRKMTHNAIVFLATLRKKKMSYTDVLEEKKAWLWEGGR